MTGRPATSTVGTYHGLGSAERLENWLDTQVVTRRLTPSQAAAMLPGYQTPVLGPCCVQVDDADADHEEDAMGWGA